MRASRLLGLWLIAACPALLGQAAGNPEAPTEPVHILGRAIDEHGEPIPHARARWFPPDEAWRVARTLSEPMARSDDSGRFALRVPPTDLAHHPLGGFALVTAPGRMSARIRLGAAPRAEMRDGALVHEFGDILLEKGIVMRGVVRDPEGKPVPGAHVQTRDLLQELSRAPFDLRAPDHVCAALSDADGRFELPGVATTGVSLVAVAEGYHQTNLPFVTADVPLQLVLRRGGHVEGIVRDPAGRPCPSYLWIQSEVGWLENDLLVTRDDGTFRLNLPFPHRYRILASPRQQHVQGLHWQSAVLDGPAKGVVIQEKVTLAPQRTLTVDVVDAVSGAAVLGIQGSLHWRTREAAAFAEIEGLVMFDLVVSPEPGRIQFPGPNEDEPETGSMTLVAPGYAPTKLEVTWTDAPPPRVSAKLVPESVIRGVVVDGTDGSPVAGAIVVRTAEQADAVLSVGATGVSPLVCAEFLDLPVTDAAGRFRIGGLAAGRYELRVFAQGHRRSDALAVEVGAAAERSDVELRIARGATFRGQFVATPPPVGWRVVLRAQPDPQDVLRGGIRGSPEMHGLIAADGTFEFHGIPPGPYDLEAVIPIAGGRAGNIRAPLLPLLVHERDFEREFDVAERLWGTLRGRVVLEGATPPLQRLVLVVERPQGGVGQMWGLAAAHALAPDGGFEIPLGPGNHRILLVDAATRLVLACKEKVTVAPRRVQELELRQTLARCIVQLEPVRDGDPIIASSLEVEIEALQDHEYVMGRSEWRRGCSLAEGQREFELWVPASPCTLRVSSLADQFRADRDFTAPPEPAAELTFTPNPAEVNRIKLTVPLPPK